MSPGLVLILAIVIGVASYIVGHRRGYRRGIASNDIWTEDGFRR